METLTGRTLVTMLHPKANMLEGEEADLSLVRGPVLGRVPDPEVVPVQAQTVELSEGSEDLGGEATDAETMKDEMIDLEIQEADMMIGEEEIEVIAVIEVGAPLAGTNRLMMTEELDNRLITLLRSHPSRRDETSIDRAVIDLGGMKASLNIAAKTGVEVMSVVMIEEGTVMDLKRRRKR